MKIKKAYQGSVPDNKILNTYSNSQTDVYSCDYVNALKSSMTTGQEIATGEYVDNKQVYVYRLNLGNLPTAGNYKIYSTNLSFGNLTVIRMIGAAFASPDMHITIPYCYPNELVGVCCYGNKVEIKAQDDKSAFSGYLNIYYTKN